MGGADTSGSARNLTDTPERQWNWGHCTAVGEREALGGIAKKSHFVSFVSLPWGAELYFACEAGVARKHLRARRRCA